MLLHLQSIDQTNLHGLVFCIFMTVLLISHLPLPSKTLTCQQIVMQSNRKTCRALYHVIGWDIMNFVNNIIIMSHPWSLEYTCPSSTFNSASVLPPSCSKQSRAPTAKMQLISQFLSANQTRYSLGVLTCNNSTSGSCRFSNQHNTKQEPSAGQESGYLIEHALKLMLTTTNTYRHNTNTAARSLTAHHYPTDITRQAVDFIYHAHLQKVLKSVPPTVLKNALPTVLQAVPSVVLKNPSFASVQATPSDVLKAVPCAVLKDVASNILTCSLSDFSSAVVKAVPYSKRSQYPCKRSIDAAICFDKCVVQGLQRNQW